jgi:hypothetical protein
MAHWKTMANYDYLGAYSLDGVAKEVTLTIASVKKELVKGEGGMTDECIVASFEEKNVGGVVVKPMILNKTNCKKIEKIYEDGDVDHWIGKRITIFATTTKVGRESKPCLRVKEEIPTTPKCVVCGKELEANLYAGVMKKYGVAVCSGECLEKLNQGKGENK